MDTKTDEIVRRMQQTDRTATSYTPPSEKEGRWYFDYDRLLWEIKAHLSGGWLTEEKTGEFVIETPKSQRPFMNTQGIEDTMAILRAFTSKIQALTILKEERVLELCRDLSMKLAKMYYVNMERYDLDIEKASVVKSMVMNPFEANLRKSLDGKSLDAVTKTETVIERKEPEKKKWGGMI